MNVNIEKVGGTAFSLLIFDDWLIGLFRTNQDLWNFLWDVRVKLKNDEQDLPEELFMLTVAETEIPEDPVKILEMAKLTKIMGRKYPTNPESEETCPYVLYTALHNDDGESDRVKDLVSIHWEAIKEALGG